MISVRRSDHTAEVETMVIGYRTRQYSQYQYQYQIMEAVSLYSFTIGHIVLSFHRAHLIIDLDIYPSRFTANQQILAYYCIWRIWQIAFLSLLFVTDNFSCSQMFLLPFFLLVYLLWKEERPSIWCLLTVKCGRSLVVYLCDVDPTLQCTPTKWRSICTSNVGSFQTHPQKNHLQWQHSLGGLSIKVSY